MKFKNFVFDLDGTLIDTELSCLKNWQFTLEQIGKKYSLEHLKGIMGLPIPEATKKLDIKIGESFEADWIKNYSRFSKDMNFFDGIKEMLAGLKEKGINLGIVTSRKKEEYTNFFKDFSLEKMFSTIVCADDTVKHKPNPEPLFKYMELTKSKPQECIYIGDMPADIACARAAKVKSGIAAWNGNKIKAPATYTFKRPMDVFKVL